MIPERKIGVTFRAKEANYDRIIYHLETSTAVASYLGFISGYHSRQEEIEKAREESS